MDRPVKPVVGDELDSEFKNNMTEQLYAQLLAQATIRYKSRYRVGWSEAEIRKTSILMVHETLDAVFVKKTRTWNRNAYANLELFLRGALDSHINNSFKKAKKEKEKAAQAEGAELAIQSLELNPEELISGEELSKLIYGLLEQEGADDEEMLVFGCLFDGLTKPKEIRTELGIGEKEFQTIWRRVLRKRDKLQIKFENNGKRV